MAYDGFQQTSNPYSQPENATNPMSFNESHPPFSPPYPMQYNIDQVNMPQPQVPPPSAPPQGQYPDPLRDQSAWPPPPPPPGGINEAVSSAVGNSGSPAYISPELLSQITANVIQQLQATGFNNTPSNQQHPSHQLPPQQWVPPPSHYVNEGSTSPPPPQIIPQTTSPSPRPILESNTYQTSPLAPEASGSTHLHPRVNSTPPEERRESPASQMSDNSQKVESRPKPPVRGDTFGTTLEKIWGKLFEDGKPTDRLGQFLRGIAAHLIENYPPGNTLVIVPEKLQKFYADTSVPSDPYPWQDIFDDRTSSISRLFREIAAEHHLVQNKLHERPDKPGLTPRGFQVWATLMIQAHPDREYERLQKAVLNMPISNPDNKKERFPKEIPRRLFPDTPNLILREEVDQSIMKHCGVDLPPITDEEIKKAAAQRIKASTSPNLTTPTTDSHSVNERERKPYYPSTSAIIDDDDEEEGGGGVPRPIERKRKPYTAHPGGGKVYNGPDTPTHRHANSFSTGSIGRESRPSFSARAPPDSPTFRNASRAPRRPTTSAPRSRSQSRGFAPGHEYRHSESDLLPGNGGSRIPATSSGGDYYYSAPTTAIPADPADESRGYRETDRSTEDQRLYDSLREREKEREKSKYGDHPSHRSSWAGEEDYYRGLLGGQGGGPAGSGYDYKSYR